MKTFISKCVVWVRKVFALFMLFVVGLLVMYILYYWAGKIRDTVSINDTSNQNQEVLEASGITYGPLGGWLDGYQYRICYQDMFDFTKDSYNCIYFNTINDEDLYLSSDLDWVLVGSCELRIEGSHCIFISNNENIKSFRTQDFYIQERND